MPFWYKIFIALNPREFCHSHCLFVELMVWLHPFWHMRVLQGPRMTKTIWQHLWSLMISNAWKLSQLFFAFALVLLVCAWNRSYLVCWGNVYTYFLFNIWLRFSDKIKWGFFRLFPQGPCWFGSFMNNHYFPALPFLTTQNIFIWMYVPLIEKRLYSGV